MPGCGEESETEDRRPYSVKKCPRREKREMADWSFMALPGGTRWPFPPSTHVSGLDFRLPQILANSQVESHRNPWTCILDVQGVPDVNPWMSRMYSGREFFLNLVSVFSLARYSSVSVRYNATSHLSMWPCVSLLCMDRTHVCVQT